MKNNKTTIIIIFLFLFLGCDRTNKAKQKFDKDTIIDGISYRMTYEISKDKKGNIKRKGYHIKRNPVGKHLFYKNSKLYAERYFDINDQTIKTLVASNEYYSDLFYKDIDTALSRLNKEIYFNSKGDTLYSKSNYIRIRMNDTIFLGDTLKVNFEYCLDSGIISGSEINLVDTQDSSFFYQMFFEGNVARFAHYPQHIGNDTLVGTCYVLEKDKKNHEELYRILSFRIPYVVLDKPIQ